MEFNVKEREKSRENSLSKLRQMGKVPGIIYGKFFGNYMFQGDSLELNSLIKKNGEHGILNVNSDKGMYKAIIKGIQRDPVSHSIIHIELQALDDRTKVITEVPIHFIGESLFRSDGGIIQKLKTNIKVQCEAHEIPKFIPIDLSTLKRGESLRVLDVELAEEISIAEDVRSVIASITSSNTEINLEEETESIVDTVSED